MANNTLELWHLGDLVKTGEDTHEGLFLLKAAGVQYLEDWEATGRPFEGEMVISECYSTLTGREIWTWDGKKVWNRPRK